MKKNNSETLVEFESRLLTSRENIPPQTKAHTHAVMWVDGSEIFGDPSWSVCRQTPDYTISPTTSGFSIDGVEFKFRFCYDCDCELVPDTTSLCAGTVCVSCPNDCRGSVLLEDTEWTVIEDGDLFQIVTPEGTLAWGHLRDDWFLDEETIGKIGFGPQLEILRLGVTA